MDGLLKRTCSITKKPTTSSGAYSKMVKTSSTLNCKKYEMKNKQTSPLMANKTVKE